MRRQGVFLLPSHLWSSPNAPGGHCSHGIAVYPWWDILSQWFSMGGPVRDRGPLGASVSWLRVRQGVCLLHNQQPCNREDEGMAETPLQPTVKVSQTSLNCPFNFIRFCSSKSRCSALGCQHSDGTNSLVIYCEVPGGTEQHN